MNARENDGKALGEIRRHRSPMSREIGRAAADVFSRGKPRRTEEETRTRRAGPSVKC